MLGRVLAPHHNRKAQKASDATPRTEHRAPRGSLSMKLMPGRGRPGVAAEEVRRGEGGLCVPRKPAHWRHGSNPGSSTQKSRARGGDWEAVRSHREDNNPHPGNTRPKRFNIPKGHSGGRDVQTAHREQPPSASGQPLPRTGAVSGPNPGARVSSGRVERQRRRLGRVSVPQACVIRATAVEKGSPDRAV